MKPASPLSDAELSDAEFEQLVRRAVALPDAPAAWIQRAIDAFAARPPAAASAMSSALGEVAQAAWRLVTAVLSFDSWAPAPQPQAMRSLPTDVRHLLFSAEGRDIDLRIAPAVQDFALVGQVLGPDEAGVVELAHAPAEPGAAPDDGVRSAALDELGEFRIDGVRRGVYSLTLRVGGDAIALPPITVGERPR